jgi:hypothetical protein
VLLKACSLLAVTCHQSASRSELMTAWMSATSWSRVQPGWRLPVVAWCSVFKCHVHLQLTVNLYMLWGTMWHFSTEIHVWWSDQHLHHHLRYFLASGTFKILSRGYFEIGN